MKSEIGFSFAIASQPFSIFFAKRGNGMKKYTTATSGGSDQYELCALP